MNPEIKKQWVAALRSGEYTQGISNLRFGGTRFCCLGVLCDLHAKATNGHWDGGEYLGEENILPRTVMEWAGLDSANPRIGSVEATEHNDGYTKDEVMIEPKTFAQIADLIDKNL